MRRIHITVVACALGILIGLTGAPARSDAQTRSPVASCSGAAAVTQSWVRAWKTKSFRAMVGLSQVSWRLRTPDAASTLSDQYGFKDVLAYRFVRCSANTVSARVTFEVRYRAVKA